MTIVFFNNKFITQDEAGISVTDRGFLLGDGIFETIRIYKGKALFFNRHYLRLENGVKILNIPLHYTEENFHQIIDKLLIDNKLTGKDAIVRITLSRGNCERGLAIPVSLTPTCLVAVFPYTPKNDNCKLIISAIRRNEFSPLSNIKSLNYLDNILAYDQAIKQQADDALMLNTHENIAGTTMANIFIIKNHTLLTPPLKDGALPGIMRGLILENAENVIEQSINLSEIKSADAILITNAIYGIRTVTQIDGILMDFSATNQLAQKLIEKLNTLINPAGQQAY